MSGNLDALVRNESYWRSLRQKGFPHLQPVYFAWASIGAPLEVASEAYITAMQKTRGISIHSVHELLEETEAVRKNLAKYLNAKPEEIFFCTNTTNAMYAILSLMVINKVLQSGDDVLTTTKEFDTTLLHFAYFDEYYGVKPVFAIRGAETAVEDARKAITPRTKAVLLSDVTHETCERLPVEELVNVARQYGLQVIVDSAQSAGQIKLDVEAIGADYFVMAGHKWMTAPIGTGFAVIRNQRLVEDPNLALVAFESDVFGLPMAHLNALGKQRVESFAGYNGSGLYERVAGFSVAVDFHREVGDAAFARIRYLTDYLRAELAQMPRINIFTPQNSPTGMTTFVIEGQNPEEVVAELDRRGFVVTHKPGIDAVRSATHYFNAVEEIIAFCAELKDLAR